jgi:hypothetical protein
MLSSDRYRVFHFPLSKYSCAVLEVSARERKLQDYVDIQSRLLVLVFFESPRDAQILNFTFSPCDLRRKETLLARPDSGPSLEHLEFICRQYVSARRHVFVRSLHKVRSVKR